MNDQDRNRSQRAAELFLEAMDMSPEERRAYLYAACSGDEELRKAVENLLANDARGSILDASQEHEKTGQVGPDDLGHTLSGTTLSPYRIIERIGEGGMSIVYKAHDDTLDRIVALKFLSHRMADNPDATVRFSREAKAAAALDHPNVCPIYAIDQIDGRVFIAMAYLEGRTLAERLREGPLEIEEALDIAIQTCRGLAAAHAKQIVHRDVKPANLMVSESPSGRLVRLLDFGVAHLAGSTDPAEAGLAIGTVSYMAPEQVECRTPDGRTDLWGLGVVLYRMISGVLPFRGESPADVLAAITASDPQPPALPSSPEETPEELKEIIGRALTKDIDSRYQTADELRGDLEALRAKLGGHGAEDGSQWAAPETAFGTRGPLITAIAVVALLVGGLNLFVLQRAGGPRAELQPVRLTSFEGAEDHAAISPDGTRVAFTWDGVSSPAGLDIYIKRIGTNSVQQLTDTPQMEHSPAWSPDGGRIAFIRQLGATRKVVIASIEGDPEIEVAEVRGSDRRFRELDWSPKGDLLATETDEGIVTISLTDNSIRRRSSPTEGARDYGPRFDPTGELLAYLRDDTTKPDTYRILSLDGGQERELTRPNDRGLLGYAAREFAWRDDGEALIYPGPSVGPGGPLHQLEIDEGTATPLGVSERSARSPDVRRARLVYTSHVLDTNIWAQPLGEKGGKAAPSVRLVASSVREDSPQFSLDGQFIVFSSDRSGAQEVWRCDLQGGNLLQVTSLRGAHAGTPRLSPDGEWVAFDATLEDGESRIYIVSSNGGEPRRLLDHDRGAERLPSWSQDGRWVYFESAYGANESNVWKASPDGGEVVQVTREGGWEAFESSDGRFLYYSKPWGEKTVHRLDLETGEEINFPELGDAGRWRYWAVGRRGIYFVDFTANPNRIQFLDFQTKNVTEVGEMGKQVDGPWGMALSPDGGTLLFVQSDRDERDLMLVQGFE